MDSKQQGQGDQGECYMQGVGAGKAWQIKHPDFGVPQPTKEADYSWLSHDLFKTEPGTFLGEPPWSF